MKSHSDSIIRTFFKGRSVERVDTDLYLRENVHPSFESTMYQLEQSILRMHVGTEILLHRYGTDASERHMDIRKLGESAIRNYASFASVARASRAYCIGVRYSAYETVAAACVVDSGANRILEMMLKIKNDQKIDEKYQRIAELMENTQFTCPSIVLHSNGK